MTVWLVLSVAVIVGIVALGLDGGRLMEERRRAQAAADAAALAAAANLYENYWVYKGKDVPGSAKTAALKVAAANGYANDGANSIVTVNSPPKSGTFAGQAEYIEVIVEANLPRGFAAIFTKKNLTAKARAVGRGRPARIGLLALRSTGPDAILNKSLALAVLGNPIIVNSDDPAAFNHSSVGLVAASSFEITGKLANTGGGLILGKKHEGAAPTADPLRYLPAPDLAAYVLRSAGPLKISSILPTILSPGVYRGGIQISGLSVVTMLPGEYILEGGGLQVSGLATLTGIGVSIYNTSGAFVAGPIDVNTLGKVILAPPLAGTYQGIGIFQDRSLSQPLSLTGFGTMAVLGTVYAPAAAVNLTASVAAAIDILGGAYICDTLNISGVGSANIDLGTNYLRVPDVTLAE